MTDTGERNLQKWINQIHLCKYLDKSIHYVAKLKWKVSVIVKKKKDDIKQNLK